MVAQGHAHTRRVNPLRGARQRIPLNIARAVRVRLRIMDSKETRGTSIILRIPSIGSPTRKLAPTALREAPAPACFDFGALWRDIGSRGFLPLPWRRLAIGQSAPAWRALSAPNRDF